MKRNIVCLLLLIATYVTYGVPARPIPFVVTQSDGTRLTLTIIGDETFHYYMTEDGVPLLQMCNEKEVSYYYAMVKDEVLVPSAILAHSENTRSNDEKKFIQLNKGDVLDFIVNKVKKIKAETSKKASRSAVNLLKQVSFTGEKRGLVILVNFADKSMDGDNPQYSIDRQFNEVGYNENGHIGSVHDYFKDQSYGKFDLTFDVVGPVTLSNEMAYYGANDYATGRKDIRVGRLVAEACSLADEYVDYSVYDWDGNGEVEQIFIIYAGYGEASGGAAYTIWPHKFSLTGCSYFGDGNGPITLDNVKIDTYACSCELSGNIGKNLNGIGTACHEFSHCLGLPDLYDVDYSGAFGMDRWDVMDSGAYSGPTGNGEVPYGYSAFERACVGWINFIELDEEVRCNLPSLNEFPIAYKITNHGNENEFFILENHQNNDWFSFVGNYSAPHGMMITHIDYNEMFWNNNLVNNYPTHMRESIIPADKSYGTFISNSKRYLVSEEEYAGDLFPGRKNVVRFSSKSHEDCGGKLFNQNIDGTYQMDMVVDNITENDGIVSFSVGHVLDIPNVLNASFCGNALNIRWNDVPNAEMYSVQILVISSFVPYNLETINIDEIKETSINIENIQSKNCNVRVLAKNDFVSSEWSEYIKVINEPDGINEIKNDNSSHTRNYNIHGIEPPYLQKQGIYIQKKNNQTRKVYIR